MAKALGVLRGGTTMKIGEGANARWYQMYEWPSGSGQYIAYQWDSVEQIEKALGKGFSARKHSETWFEGRTIAVGAAEEVVGSWGSWSQQMNVIMEDAARQAGVRDPGLAGQIAGNAEMKRILAAATVGKWTPEQIKAEQRKTSFWKNVLYPGIENFYDNTTDPERAWVDYKKQVEPALEALGYSRDANGSFNKQIATMLNKKIDSGVFLSQVPIFIQAKQNAEFATILNQWAERDLGKNIGFTDWFNLMAGESQPELEAVAERAQLEWVSQNQGSGLSQAEIENLAARTQLDPLEAQRAFSEFNQGILALGDEGLSKYGLSREAVLSAAAGVTPADGRSVDEIKLLVAKTAREQALADDEKINFYVGFDPTGRPTRPGLQSLAPEGA